MRINTLKGIFLILMLWCLPVGGATPLLTVDSLLNDYLRAPEQYYQLGQHIVDLCLGDDPLNDRQLRIDNSLPEDSANLLVFFAAERYYFIHSYFDKSLEYIGMGLLSGFTVVMMFINRRRIIADEKRNVKVNE